MSVNSLVFLVTFVTLLVISRERILVCGQEEYRLSNTTKPISYDIELTVNTDCEEDYFSGSVSITIEALQVSKEITLHTSEHINIENIEIYEEDGTEVEIGRNLWNWITEIRTITLKDDLKQKEQYIMNITYTGKISTDNLGFYRSTYTDEDREKVCMLSTQFAPTQARRAFPCYDEPSMKANFSVRIIHPVGTRAISNGQQHPVSSQGEDTILTVFDEVDRMPSYLVGFAIGDFDYKENVSDNIAHQVYSRKSEQSKVDFALDFAPKIYKYLAGRFQMNLKLRQLKHVAIPDFYFSAMENWGMITYKESRLLFDPEVHPVNLEHTISNVMSHEVAHHWFGDLVTMKWWTHVWLKEGFATLFSYYGQDGVRTSHEAIQFLLIEKLQFVFTIDSDPLIKPMSEYKEIQSEIMANYDKIAYDKACCVLRMMQHAFSEKVFDKALVTYLSRHQYSNTDEDDLFRAIQESLEGANQNQDVSGIMRSWTQQRGYPVVKVSLTKTSIHLQQERFYNPKPKEDPSEPPIWWIPITIFNLNGKMIEYWMNEPELTIDCEELMASCSSGDVFLVNYKQNGYYRVNYDDTHWKSLAVALKVSHDKIHVNNRAQLIDDAFNLAFVGQLKYSIVFDLIEYISDETEYAPWAALEQGLTTLKQYLSGSSNIARLNQFVQSIVERPYRGLVLTNSNISRFIRKFTRQIIVRLACEYGLEHCLKDERVYDHPNLRQIYYCNKLRSGGNEMYANLRKMLKNTTDPILRAELIWSLGCSTDKNQLAVLLLTAIDQSNSYGLEDSERTQLIQSVYRKSYLGVVQTINFFRNEKGVEFFKPTDAEKLCLDFAKYVNSYDLHVTFNDIMEKTLTDSAFKKARDVVRANLWWIADYGATALNSLPVKGNNAPGIHSSVAIIVSSLFIVRYF